MTLIKSISGFRGTIGGKPGDTLNPIDIAKSVSAYASLRERVVGPYRRKIVVGRDARISGEMVSHVVCGTLMGMGFDVLNIGLASTPTTELAVTMERACGGIIITASHNPRQWNALKFLNDPAGLNMGIDFGHWMAFMFPLVIILLIISWRILLFFFPFSKKTIELEIKGSVHHGWRMNVVIVTFIITILLWVIPKSVTGIDSYNVAMVPIGVFAVTGVITAKDLQEINWSVIWMVAGGFALGFGMNGSGLADAALESIPFGEWSPIVILLISGLICYILSNFISNTATAALLVPILAVVCTGMGDKLHALGGTSTVLIGIAIAASSAMCLPISTPPNAIAYSTGLVKQNDMLKMGLICGIVSLVLGYSVLYFIGKSGFLL